MTKDSLNALQVDIMTALLKHGFESSEWQTLIFNFKYTNGSFRSGLSFLETTKMAKPIK